MDKKFTPCKQKIRHFLKLLLLLFPLAFPPSQLQALEKSQIAAPLKITEVYYDTPGADAEEEWLELANFGSETIDLSPFKVGDEERQGGGEGMVQFPEGSAIEPGQTILVAQTAVSFQRLFGFSPTFEIQDSLPGIPDMRPYPDWASGEVGLANDGDEVLLLDERDVIIDAVAFGEEGEGIPGAFRPLTVPAILRGQSIERVPAGCDTDTAVDWIPQPFPTPGHLTQEGECRPSSNPEPLVLIPIGLIQGRGETAERLNQTVNFSGIVTGWIEDQNAAGTRFYTLFVQDVPGTEDGDPQTSDAIALFLATLRPNLQPGDLVQVTGQVTEFFGLTEIDDNDLQVTLIDREQPLPTPIPLEPPATDETAYFEALESMLVSIDSAVVVGPTFSGCGLAVAPSDDNITHYIRHQLADSSPSVINILHTSDVDCGDFPNVKAGDRITGLSGPLHFHFDQFKIVNQQTAVLQIQSTALPDLPAPLTAAGGQITIATMNLQDYFDTNDDTGSEAEPKPTAAELALKQAKLIQAIGRSLACPTIIGIQEVENAALLQDLAAGLVEPCAFTYQVTHLESADGRGIDVALLSDPRQINILDAALRQTCSLITTDVFDTSVDCPAGQSPLFSRPPLQVNAAVHGQSLALFINHLKSKREGEIETAPRRLAQGAHLRILVEELLQEDEKARIVVMGDFNDFARSPVMETMTAENRLINVFLNGPAALPREEQYTYIFSGYAQMLDTILLSPALASRVIDTMILHANTDFPYTYAIDTSTAGLPFHFSDHDVPLVLLNLEPEPPPETKQPAEIPIVTPQPTTGTPIPTLTPEPADETPTAVPILPIIAVLAAAAAVVFLVIGIRDKPQP